MFCTCMALSSLQKLFEKEPTSSLRRKTIKPFGPCNSPQVPMAAPCELRSWPRGVGAPLPGARSRLTKHGLLSHGLYMSQGQQLVMRGFYRDYMGSLFKGYLAVYLAFSSWLM